MQKPREVAYLKCIAPDCGTEYEARQVLTSCKKCDGLLDVQYDWDKAGVPSDLRFFKGRYGDVDNIANLSGVWRFRELLPFIDCHDAGAYLDQIVSLDGTEGWTRPIHVTRAAKYTGMKPGSLFLQFEGQNPTGSFKDNGMTAAFTHAKLVGAKTAACASTGNTSASLAAYAANSGFLRAIVFIGDGKIAHGKLSQSLEYGATTLQIQGDFDDAMKAVQYVAKEKGIYLVNSVNPFRLEGQKSIMFRVLEGLNGRVPDWVVCPGGNMGNASSFGKAFDELYALGLIKKKPKIAIINAEGANTLYQLVNEHGLAWNDGRIDHAKINQFYETMKQEGKKAKTLATAIEIGQPVNLAKALRTLDHTKGVVEQVSDQEMRDAKAVVGSNGMFGCEPASAATVAGTKKLVAKGVIHPDELVVGILTGNMLKDPEATVTYHMDEKNPFANKPVKVPNDLEAMMKAMGVDNVR
jgi:threonine synthase